VEESSDSKPEISKKRQKILDKALAQLRKARGQMDPALLKNIRRMIAGSPDMMKKLGVGNDLKPEQAKPAKQTPAPATSKKAVKPPPQPESKLQSKMSETAKNQELQKPAPVSEKKAEHEKIDQGKNMEVMAKLLELSPDSRDKIIATIKKAGE
jgi:hypothetical protein